nr:hypothetical protein CFP56_56458 [Quercus suber]
MVRKQLKSGEKVDTVVSQDHDQLFSPLNTRISGACVEVDRTVGKPLLSAASEPSHALSSPYLTSLLSLLLRECSCMASYHDPYDYDSRSRPSRTTKYETIDRPREDTFSSGRHRPRDPRNQRLDDPRSSYQPQSQPSQHHYPPSSPDLGRNGNHPHKSTIKKRSSWPPSALCEDEVVSLKREAGSAQLLKEARKSNIPARGVIDQEVLMEYAPDWINEHEKRFVLLTGSERGSHGDIPTPPTSEDEKHRRNRRHAAKVDTGVKEQIPEMSKRTSSPYTYKPAKSSKDGSIVPDRFLSPDVLTPPLQERPTKQHRSNTTSGLPSPRGHPGRLSPSFSQRSEYPPTSKLSDEACAVDDSPIDVKHARTERRRRESAKSSFDPQTPNHRSRTSTIDFAPSSMNVPPVRKANLDARRNITPPQTPSTAFKRDGDTSRRPSPLASTFALGAIAASTPHLSRDSSSLSEEALRRSREGSDGILRSSRNVSPASSTTHRERSPQRPASYSSTRSNESNNASSPTSRQGSADGSRPSSPVPRRPGDSPRLPRTDVDWSSLMAANTARRGKPPSRLSTSMRQESMPEMPRAASVVPSLPITTSDISTYEQPPSSAGLPYPDDDGLVSSPAVFMPSEREYQQFGPAIAGLTAPFSRDARADPRVPSSGKPSSTQSRRPALSQRHSDMYVPSVDERPRVPGSRQSAVLSSQTRKELEVLTKKGLLECSRTEPVAGEDEWYTVIGSPELLMCPECSDIFERTVFRAEIRLAPPRDLSEKVQCTMGTSKWIQTAWLLTLQWQRTNLALLKDIASIDETGDPCLGIGDGFRSWYGLRDSQGNFVWDFYVCYSDVRKIERLLPTLSGMFVRMPQPISGEKHRCAVGNTKGDRFQKYMDGLIATHERAIASRRAADPALLLALIERESRLQECRRDLMFTGAFWHFIPALPALTVCEECFEHLVEPEIQNRSSLAARFNRTVQPVYGEGVGSSCQLYSPYMRQVFAKALRNNDFEYLASRAKRRRDAELRLQARWQELARKAKRLSGLQGSDVEGDRRRLEKDIARIGLEWRDQWE